MRWGVDVILTDVPLTYLELRETLESMCVAWLPLARAANARHRGLRPHRRAAQPHVPLDDAALLLPLRPHAVAPHALLHGAHRGAHAETAARARGEGREGLKRLSFVDIVGVVLSSGLRLQIAIYRECVYLDGRQLMYVKMGFLHSHPAKGCFRCDNAPNSGRNVLSRQANGQLVGVRVVSEEPVCANLIIMCDSEPQRSTNLMLRCLIFIRDLYWK